MPLKIVRMNEDNIHSVKEIEDRCFVSPWSLDSFKAELCKEGAYFYLAMMDEQPAGYIGFNMVLDEGYIANVAVVEKFRRKGVARTLMEKVIATARENSLAFVSLEVRESNTPAKALYESLGFSQQGVRRNFYRNPLEDGLILTKFL